MLSLNAMSPASSIEWNGFLDRLRILIDSHKSFIIDVRGNGGGSMEHVYSMARLFYGLPENAEVPSPRKETVKRQTPEAWALVANYF